MENSVDQPGYSLQFPPPIPALRRRWATCGGSWRERQPHNHTATRVMSMQAFAARDDPHPPVPPPPAHPKKEVGRGRHPSGKLCAVCGKPAITREGTADKAPRPHEWGMQIQGYGNKKNCNNYDKGVRKGE